MVSPDELMREFVAANPKLKPDMIAVQCGGPGNRLKEVRICFDKGGSFRACGRNEDQRQAVLGRPHVRAAGADHRRAYTAATSLARRTAAAAAVEIGRRYAARTALNA